MPGLRTGVGECRGGAVKFEYQVGWHIPREAGLKDGLKFMGDKGWELVSVVARDDVFHTYWKRPVAEAASGGGSWDYTPFETRTPPKDIEACGLILPGKRDLVQNLQCFLAKGHPGTHVTVLGDRWDEPMAPDCRTIPTANLVEMIENAYTTGWWGT